MWGSVLYTVGHWVAASLGSTHEMPGVPSTPAQSWQSKMSPDSAICPGKEGVQNCPWWRTTYLVYGVCINEIRQIQNPPPPPEMYTLWGFFFFFCLLVYFHLFLVSLALKVIPSIFFSPFSWINQILSDVSLMQSCRKWIKIFQSREI